jgi:hypothetical protein
MYLRINLSKKIRKKSQTSTDKTIAFLTFRHSSETWTLTENKGGREATFNRKLKFLTNLAG